MASGNGVLSFFRTKPLKQLVEDSREKKGGLKRVLSAFDLTALGVGAIIGAGVFVLTGTAAHKAGPAVMLSFVFAGFACVFAAFCYAEFAARFPIAGSAYTYAYASLGELLAWIIGWDLILEYTIGAAAVARGWSGYLEKVAEGFNLALPEAFTHMTLMGHIVNPMAGVIIFLLTALLIIGIKESAKFNAFIVFIKVAVVLLVIAAGSMFINPANWHPFMPFGMEGVFTGAATVFFAYIGFDAVSTAAEEVKNPRRDLPIGIIASLFICTVLYILVSGAITGMVPFSQIDLNAPLASAFGDRGILWIQTIISIGAFAGLTTVILVLLMSQPRIYYSMARDGLLMPWFGKIHQAFGTPINATIVTGALAVALTLFFDIEKLADMVAIGTLFAFSLVCGGVMVLRYRTEDKPFESAWLVLAFSFGFLFTMASALDMWPWPFHYFFDRYTAIRELVLLMSVMVTVISAGILFMQKTVNVPKTFKCPWVPFIPMVGIAANLCMMLHLSRDTWMRLWIWLALGMVIYLFYGRRHSKLASAPTKRSEKSPAKTLSAKKPDAEKSEPAQKASKKQPIKKKAAVKKPAAKKPAVKKSPAKKKPATQKAATKKAPEKKEPVKKETAKKSPAKKAPAKPKPAAKKTTPKKPK